MNRSKRSGRSASAIALIGCLLLSLRALAVDPATVELQGKTFSSSQWGSGWLELDTPVDFATGDRLRLFVGGTARNVLVRLLPEGEFPDSPSGVLDRPVEVGPTRILEVALPSAHARIVQVSVHGGVNPWGRFPLGAGNGPATLERAQLIRARSEAAPNERR